MRLRTLEQPRRCFVDLLIKFTLKMDSLQTFSTLMVIFQVLLATDVSAVGAQGCWSETPRNRFFSTSPGSYDPTTMIPDYCQTKCGAFEFKYAALYNGHFCFCSNSLPGAGAVANSYCTVPCAGNPLLTCGNVLHVSVFETLAPLLNLQMSSNITGVAEAPAIATLTYEVEKGRDVLYQVDFDDGAGFTGQNETGLESRKLYLPGSYVITMTADDAFPETQELQAVTAVILESGPEDIEVECDVLVTHEEGSCLVTVWKGSNLNLQAEIPAMASLISINPIVDPEVEMTGLWSSDPSGTSNSAGPDKIVLLVSTAVKKAGKIIGLRLHVKRTGSLDLMVLKPTCSSGSYCPLSNTCETSCDVGPVCTLPHVFCMQKQACSDSCSAPTKSYGTSTIPVDGYEVTSVISIAFSSLGEQWYALHNPVDVTAGDILGLELTIFPPIISVVDGPSMEDIEIPGPHIAPNEGATYNGGTGLGGRHVVQPYVSYGSKTVLKYNFPGPAGTHDLDVTVANNRGFGNPATNLTQVTIVEGIDFAIITGPRIIKLGDSSTFSLEPHTGSGVSYEWNITDGHTDVGANLVYTFPAIGMFNITVSASNQISSKENTTEVHVQEAIQNVAVVADNGEANSPVLVNISMTAGSDFTCEVEFGDGASATTIAEGPVPHTYLARGSYTILVNCSNDVSHDSDSFEVHMQEAISGLRLDSDGASSGSTFVIVWRIDTGSDVSFQLDLDGSTIPVDDPNSNPAGLRWQSVQTGPLAVNGYPYVLTATNAINTETISGTFIILDPIVGPSFSSDLDNVTTDDVVTFTVDLTSGSDVSVVVDLKDGSPNRTYTTSPRGTPWTTAWVFTHVFINGCNCRVTAWISNPAGSFELSFDVMVMVGFSVLSWTVPGTEYYLYEPPATVDDIFLTTSGPMPTEPTLTIDWGDNTPLEVTDTILVGAPGYSWKYDDIETFYMTFTLSNSISSRSFDHRAIVIEKLVGPKITLEFPSAPLNQPFNVTFSLYRGDQGNHTLLNWDFGDGNPITVTERQGVGEDGADTLTVTYTIPGSKTVTVEATAPLNQSVSDTITFNVIDGVDEPSAVVTVGGDVTLGSPTTFTLQYNSATMPFNAFIQMDWYGDGTLLSSPVPFTIATNGGTQDITTTYAKNGLFDAKMIIYNDASRVVKTVQAGIYQPFVNLQVEVTYKIESDLPEPPRQNGIGNAGQLYPIDKTIYFKLLDDNTAFATTYQMDSTSGPESVSTTASENDFPYNFTTVGEYTLEIRASNPLYDATVTVTFSVVKRAQNLEVTEEKPNVYPGRPKRILVSLTGYDDSTCVYIDWNDLNKQWKYANEPSACTANASYPYAAQAGTVDVLVSEMVSHRYLREGRYTVTVEARNAYGVEVKSVTFPISYTECSSPVIEIHNQETSLYYAPSFIRSKITRLLGLIDIDCPQSYQNTKLWTMEEVDAEGQIIKEVNFTDIETTRAELYLPARSLPVGIYKATYTVIMTSGRGAQDFFRNSKFTYLKIIQSELLGSLVEGGLTEMTIGSGQNLMLEPLVWSFDPDLDPSEPQGLTVFKWICQELGSDDNSTCIQNMVAGADSQNIDGSIWVPGARYNVSVYLTKDIRTAVASLIINVNGTSPPLSTIRCFRGSICYPRADGYLGLASSKISLECDCTTCSGEEQYEWRLFIDDYRWPEGWRPIREPFVRGNSIMSGSDSCGSNEDTCIFSKALSLKQELFEQYESKSDVIKTQCIVYDQGRTGKVSLNIYFNKPPQGGNCTITPLSATATVESTRQWEIYCYDWQDEDGIKEFQVTSFFSDNEVIKEITSYPTPSHGFIQKVTLPVGPEYRDYKQDVYVTIRDLLNAATTIKIAEVQVFAPPYDQLQRYLGGALYSRRSTFFKTFHEGDQRSVSEITSAISLLMATDAKRQRIDYAEKHNVPSNWVNTGYGPSDSSRPTAFVEPPPVISPRERFKYERERDIRTKLKAKMLKFALDLAMDDFVSIQQLSSMLAEVTSDPTELTTETQEMILEATKKMFENLNDPVKMRNVPQEEIERAMNNLMVTVGGVVDAAGTHGEFPTLQELDSAKRNPDWGHYDTSIKALGDNTDVSNAVNYDEALRLHSKNVHKTKVTLEAKTVAMEAAEMMERSAEIFSNYAIPGQSYEGTGYRSKQIMQKNLASNFLGTEIRLTDSNTVVKLPDKLTDLFPDGSVSEDDILTIQVVQTPNVANRYGGRAAVYLPLEAHGHYVTIDVYDQNGKRKQIPETTEPISVDIPNDPYAKKNPIKVVNPFVNEQNRFQVHKTELYAPRSSLHLDFELVSGVQYLVVVRFNATPDPLAEGIDFVFSVPSTLPPDPDQVHPYKIMIDNNQTGENAGDWFVGVVERNSNFINAPLPTNAEIAERYPKNSGEFRGYNLTIRVAGCFSYTPGANDWSNEGCLVSPETTDEVTQCLCNHLTTFAGGLLVVPNTIDWGFVFANADFTDNPTIYITQIVIFLSFIFAFVLARRKDKADMIKRGLAPLLDNNPEDKYYYEITVCTGMRPSAGTNSKVYLVMASAEEESSVRWLCDSKRDIFKRGMTNGFLMAVPKRLGHINYIRVWHDNSGRGKFGSWYLNYIAIKDLQTETKEVFIANRWFALEEDDGQIDRIIPLANKEQLTDFGHQFGERSKKDMIDGHLWFSVVAKPPQSRFSCVERVACCMCLLFMTMLTNAMFYNVEEEGTDSSLEFGPFSMTIAQISIGIMSTLIVFPANLLLVLLFRKSEPRKVKETNLVTADSSMDVTSTSDQVIPKLESSSSRADDMVGPSSSQDTTKLTLKSKKKKKSFKLPWWCIILAWILLVILTIGSAAMVTFYGISFKDTKCRKWVTSLIFSFFTSVFITQPIKVFLTAVFLSLVIKNPVSDEDEEEEDSSDSSLNDKSNFLHPPQDGIHNFRQTSYKPPSEKELEKIRATRVKQVKMWGVVREIIFYLIFLWILMVVSHRDRSANHFRYKDTMFRTFIQSLDTDIHFEKIHNKDDLWKWAKTGLLNGLQAGSYYNLYPALRLRSYINDKTSRILGHATLRQHRVDPALCDVPSFFKKIISECNEQYSLSAEDTRPYDIGWRTFNTTLQGSSSEYQYADADTLNGYPYWGYQAVYSGGGYVVHLTGNKTDILDILEGLEEDQWVDRYTRTVFVEFTVYNPQVNLFSVNTMLIEFDTTNGAITSYRFEPALLLPYAESGYTFYVICEIVFLLYLIAFFLLELKKFYHMRLKYFFSFWNMVELSITAFSLAAVVIYFYRLHETNKLTKQFKADKGNKYIKFQYVGYWNETLAYMIGIVVFLTTLKFLRLLRFNQRVSMLGNTLKHSSRSLFHFGIIALVVFLAFCQLFFLTYMNVDEKYSTFVESIVTSVLMMMGKFNIYTMIMAEPILTQIFVLLFVVSLTFIIVNMFVSILNDTFSDVRENILKQSNEYEILEFMLESFQSYTGLRFWNKKELDPDTRTGVQGYLNDDMDDDMRQDANRRWSDAPSLKELPEKFERLLCSLSSAYTNAAYLPGFEDGMAVKRMTKSQPCMKEPYKAPPPPSKKEFAGLSKRRISFPRVS